jgi:hypothetical protein
MLIFYSEELLATCPTPKLDDHPLSAVLHSLLNMFAAADHIWLPFLHSPPKDTPVPWLHGDTNKSVIALIISVLFFCKKIISLCL